MYIVRMNHQGAEFYLRGTIWTAYLERADRFEMQWAAEAQLENARKFMKAAQYKAARIEEE